MFSFMYILLRMHKSTKSTETQMYVNIYARMYMYVGLCACFIVVVHPSINRSMGSPPVGAQCPLTSSLCEFLVSTDWLWYLGLSPVLVSIALPFAFHISVFSINSSSPAIGFHSSIFYGGGICTPPPTIPPYFRLGTGTMVI